MEKALRELLEVAEEVREALLDRYDGAPDGGCQWMANLLFELDRGISVGNEALS